MDQRRSYHDDIIISVEPILVKKILLREKKVEVRRRNIRARPNSRLWLYGKMPVGAILGCVEVRKVVALPPNEFWTNFGHQVCIDLKHFRDYCRGAAVLFGLILENPVTLDSPIALEDLRKLEGAFRPPQFCRYLSANDKILHELILRYGISSS